MGLPALGLVASESGHSWPCPPTPRGWPVSTGCLPQHLVLADSLRPGVHPVGCPSHRSVCTPVALGSQELGARHVVSPDPWEGVEEPAVHQFQAGAVAGHPAGPTGAESKGARDPGQGLYCRASPGGLQEELAGDQSMWHGAWRCLRLRGCPWHVRTSFWGVVSQASQAACILRPTVRWSLWWLSQAEGWMDLTEELRAGPRGRPGSGCTWRGQV